MHDDSQRGSKIHGQVQAAAGPGEWPVILAVLYIWMQHQVEMTVQIPGQQGMTVCPRMK